MHLFLALDRTFAHVSAANAPTCAILPLEEINVASAPLQQTDPSQADELTREEWWKLFDELRLSQHPAYAEYGGPVAFVRQERDAVEDR